MSDGARMPGPHGKRVEDAHWDDHPKNQHFKDPENAAVADTEVNQPDRYEQFTLAEGEKKIEEKIDTRTQSTSIFTINKEDHTIVNLLRQKLLENSHVTFAAYKVPHPLFATCELRIATDGEITPREALIGTSKELVRELEVVKQRFKGAYDLTKMSQQGDGGANGAPGPSGPSGLGGGAARPSGAGGLGGLRGAFAAAGIGGPARAPGGASGPTGAGGA